MLRAENIRFAYRGGTPILRDVSLELAPGRVLGLLAPSGHGKSTLARILAGRERPDSGAVTLDGGPLGAHRPCRVQYLNQSPELAVDPRWRMERVLTECWPVDERTRRALGIEPGRLGRLPGGLSGGELQRFCIARALHPQLRHLVAGEMTTMLDPITQALIRSRLVGLISSGSSASGGSGCSSSRTTRRWPGGRATTSSAWSGSTTSTPTSPDPDGARRRAVPGGAGACVSSTAWSCSAASRDASAPDECPAGVPARACPSGGEGL